MAFLRKKKQPSGRIALYEVKSVWNKEKKQSRAVSKYLGMLDDQGNLIEKNTVKRGRKKKIVEQPQNNACTATSEFTAQDKEITLQPIYTSEKSIVDFGNSYLVHEFIKGTAIYKHLEPILQQMPALLLLLTYRICQPGPMHNADLWYQGTILSILSNSFSKRALSSQNISTYMSQLGCEELQRSFFTSYLSEVTEKQSNISIVIDSTSTPNDIRSELNAYGYCDGGIAKQFRTHFVMNQETKQPLFFRNVAGNIADISTLTTTLDQISAMGLKNSFVLLDAGFTSEENIQALREKNIDFLTRLPAGRSLYKKLVLKESPLLEDLSNIIKFGNRILFVRKIETDDLYGEKGYAYIILDPERKSKEIQDVMLKEHKNKYLTIPANETEEEKKARIKKDQKFRKEQDFNFANAGVFILISSKDIAREEVLSSYYSRQGVEQLFGFAKNDLELLPIRCHNDSTVSGYFFMQFILLSIYIELRDKIKLKKNQTVEQALLSLRSLKAKVYNDKIVILEATKSQKEIFDSCSIIVPKSISGV